MSKFSELEELVGQLKDKNQETIKVLNCVESTLVEMDLDLESWLMHDPLTSQPAMVEGQAHVVEQVMGFGPYNGKHVLLVKEIVHAKEDGWESRGLRSEGEPKPLREAPRALRFLAIGRLDALVDSLTSYARLIIAAFDSGRKKQKHC